MRSARAFFRSPIRPPESSTDLGSRPASSWSRSSAENAFVSFLAIPLPRPLGQCMALHTKILTPPPLIAVRLPAATLPPMTTLPAFKAYDIRGRIPSELNEDLAYRIGQATAAFLKPKRLCVGRDIRLSSEQLCTALVRGLTDSGVDVYDIGLCGTEGVYFA